MEGAVLYLLSPLSIALLVMLGAGALFAWGRRRWALSLAGAAFAGLWICSTPWVADQFVGALEGQFAALTPEATPAADAILVLGGAVSGAKPPERPTLTLGRSSTRVWHAAALYRAGKARWVVVAAGNRPEHAGEQVEADAIAQMLVQLGVPRSAIVLEGVSQTTRQNAKLTLPVLERLGARRVLLVTSGIHMPRALQTFVKIWGPGAPQLIPAATAIHGPPAYSEPWEMWLPSLEALISVTAALKEFAGMAGVAIIL